METEEILTLFNKIQQDTRRETLDEVVRDLEPRIQSSTCLYDNGIRDCVEAVKKLIKKTIEAANKEDKK